MKRRVLDFIRKEYQNVCALTDDQILSTGLSPKKVLKAIQTLKLTKDKDSMKLVRKFEKSIFNMSVDKYKSQSLRYVDDGVYDCSDCAFWRYFATHLEQVDTTNPNTVGGCNACVFRAKLNGVVTKNLWEELGVDISLEGTQGCKDCALACTCTEYRPTRPKCVYSGSGDMWDMSETEFSDFDSEVNDFSVELSEGDTKWSDIDIEYIRKEYRTIRNLSNEDIYVSSVNLRLVADSLRLIHKLSSHDESISLNDALVAFGRVNKFEIEMFGHPADTERSIKFLTSTPYMDIKNTVQTMGVEGKHLSILDGLSTEQMFKLISRYNIVDKSKCLGGCGCLIEGAVQEDVNNYEGSLNEWCDENFSEKSVAKFSDWWTCKNLDLAVEDTGGTLTKVVSTGETPSNFLPSTDLEDFMSDDSGYFSCDDLPDYDEYDFSDDLDYDFSDDPDYDFSDEEEYDCCDDPDYDFSDEEDYNVFDHYEIRDNVDSLISRIDSLLEEE